MKYRGITISPCLNGFVCTIGCQTAVFESCDSLLSALEKYLNNPDKTEKEYMEATRIRLQDLQPVASSNRSFASQPSTFNINSNQ
jgi:hypothetical protein